MNSSQAMAEGGGALGSSASAEADEPPLEYELVDLDPPSTARVTAELEGGRFTIATEQPHVKVAWRISHRKEEPR